MIPGITIKKPTKMQNTTGRADPASLSATAPIKLGFLEAVGSKTGALLPTGFAREEIDGVPVTLVDYATPMLLLRAGDLGLAGDETPAELDANAALLARLEELRREAGRPKGHLETHREGFRIVEAISCRKTIAEGDDHRLVIGHHGQYR